MLNPDFRDMLFEFNAAGVEYLIVGAYAVGQHGYPRATGDMDFWVRGSPENASRVLHALAAFGTPETLVTLDDLLDPEMVAQIGVEPNRIDILTDIDGVEFDDAYPHRVVVRLGDVDIPFVGLRHLIANRRATGRPEDAVDVMRLEAIVRRTESQTRGGVACAEGRRTEEGRRRPEAALTPGHRSPGRRIAAPSRVFYHGSRHGELLDVRRLAPVRPAPTFHRINSTARYPSAVLYASGSTQIVSKANDA